MGKVLKMQLQRLQQSFIVISLLSINLISFKQVFAEQVDIAELVRSAQSGHSSKNVQTTRNNVFTKNSVDKTLSATVFNWTSGNIKNIPLNKSQPIKQQRIDALNSYFNQTAIKHGANKTSISSSNNKMTQLHDTGRGAIIGKYQQTIDGIEVFGRNIAVMINQKNEFIASSGYFAHSKSKPSSIYQLQPSQAIAKAFNSDSKQAVNPYTISLNETVKSYRSVSSKVSAGNTLIGTNSRVKKVYYPIDSQKIVPAYYVELETSIIGERSGTLYSYVIDGQSGKVLFKNNLTNDVATTYKVFVEPTNFIPFDGPHGDDLTPHPTGNLDDTPPVGEDFVLQNTVTLDNAGLSTNDPWLIGADTTTSGNNVDAYADISGQDGFDDVDVRPSMSAANAFEYDFATYGDGLVGDAQKHAVVSLFYVNNFLHDWFYDNGFDEIAGNAQLSNLGRGGQEGDPLKVEAQDFSGLNNANMSTPADGSSPRMQMYVWDFKSTTRITIDGDSEIETAAASFGPRDFDVTGILTLVDDGVNTTGDGCEPVTQDLTGLIAIIDSVRVDSQYLCDFTVQVKNVQDAGAIGAIIAGPFSIGVFEPYGEDNTIVIPSMMVTIPKGDEIKSALLADDTLQSNLFNQVLWLDGTLDNGIVAHEWAHYLTNRLVGNSNGLSNNQGRSMGEGWSDFVALLLSVKESDSLLAGNENFQGVYSSTTFIGNAYYGIRRAPYSTDMNKNALTFKYIEKGVPIEVSHPLNFGQDGSNNSQVHRSGEIWANALWEVYAGLLNKPSYTFEQAQQVMKDYLIASLKLTPNRPTFLEARDAMLAAALANNAEDFDIVRTAFTKRGMGANAVAPDRSSEEHSGVVEDFNQGVDLKHNIAMTQSSLTSNTCDNDGVFDAGEKASFTLQFDSFSSQSIPAFQVGLSSPDDVIFVNETINVPGISGFGQTSSVTFDVIFNTATSLQDIELIAAVEKIGSNADDFVEPPPFSLNVTGNYDFLATKFNDDMSNDLTSYKDWQVTSPLETIPRFVLEHGGWYGENSNIEGTSDLVTPVIKAGIAGNVVISFDHFYSFLHYIDDAGTIFNWDGGVIEVSVNGASYVDVVDYGATLLEPYNGVTALNDVLGSREAYTNTNSPDSFSLSANSITFPDGLINNQDFQLRFRIGTQGFLKDFGWLIDNVVVTNAAQPMFSEIVAEDYVCLSGNPPTVNAGDDINNLSRNLDDISVDLTGVSNDVDGDNLVVKWSQVSGTPVSLVNSSSNNANFTMPRPADDSVLVFEFSANDGTRTSTDQVQVNITLNRAPTVSVSDGSVLEGESFTFTAVSADNEGDSLTYTWIQTSGPSVTLTNETSLTPSFVAPIVGSTTNLTFDVIANDGDFDSAISTATITVENINTTAPTVSAGDDIVVVSRDNSDINVSLSATASDVDGDTLTYLWTQISGAPVTVNNANSENASFTIPSPDAHITLIFQLSVEDGVHASTDTVQVDIRLNQAPTVSVSNSSVVEGQNFTFSATSSDSEEDALTYTWSQTSGPNVTLTNPTSLTPSFTAPQVNANTTLTFSVVANDGSLDSQASTANVAVTNQANNTREESSSGGGGSVTIYLLLLLGFARVVRKTN